MNTFLIILAILGGAVLLVLGAKNVKKLWFNARSSASAGVKNIDKANAVNNMKQAVDDAKGEISGYVSKLNESQGQINSLTRESNEANSEVNVLTAQVNERAREVNGNTDDPVLLDLAEQLSTAQARAADATKELGEQTTLHNSVLTQVKEAVKRADDLEKEADRLGVKLDLSATRAELASVGINFQKSSAHSSLAAASGYAEEIQKQIDTNNGAVEVAKQLNQTSASSAATAEWKAKQSAKATLANLGIGTTKPADTAPQG
jgi:chromosome segregation ATPase